MAGLKSFGIGVGKDTSQLLNTLIASKRRKERNKGIKIERPNGVPLEWSC
jgi:hypothetical protein